MKSSDLKDKINSAIDDSDALALLVYELLKGRLQLIELTEGGYHTLTEEEILKKVGYKK